MASTQEPEVQFAQRLASNEKPVRTRALKKLRKYVNVRSQKATGGFSADELLRLWKGLFYCLWMQDKPLLQEELSKQISSLILSFHDIHGQMLYLESFLQTCKREWTGIDRLRMDKFYQLVRFMFRQTFEALKRKTWESSAVASFLDVLAAQLLHSGSAAPCELQLHILDLYMTELAAVGSAELTADQNLKFIEPFCRTAARTKDRTLFSAICGSVFSTIIDQAPFAIEDLMKEVKAAAEASDSDSGQASEEDDGGGEGKEKTESKAVGGKGAGKQLNGKKSSEEDDDDDDDELLHLEEDSDTELPGDEDIGPVLQFDFGALADKLFESASRSSTPGQNRPRLYRIIKVLRDLSEGIFPQDEYPEEVSTDEDDEMFGSRKRMKRGRRRAEDNEDSAPAAKKSKGKKETPDELNKDGEPADGAAAADDEDQKKKKKKKRKRKKKIKAAEGQIVAPEAEGRLEGSEEAAQSSVSSVTVTEAPTETLLLSEKTQPSVTVTEDAGPPPPAADQSKSDDAEPKPEVTEADDPTPAAEMSSEDAPVSAKKRNKRKKKKKGLTAGGDADGTEAGSCEASGEAAAPETDAATPAKKKKKGVEAEGSPEGELQVNGVSSETEATSERCEASAGEDATGGGETPTNATTPAKKKGKRKKKSLEEEPKVEVDVTPASQQTAATPAKKTPKKKQQQQVKVDERETDPTPAAPSAAVTPQKKKTNRKEEFNSAAGEDAEKELEEIAVTTPATRRKKKKNPQLADETQAQVAGGEEAELPLNEASSGTPAKKKKRKVPVVFEFEADELEAAAAVNGLAEEATPKKTKLGDDVGEPSTPLSRKKSQKKTKTGPGFEFITFKSKASTPTPLFCRTKGGLNTPLSRKKKSQTPKSDSKKVTFGLKNNKTAEFRKTDRSLLVSPDGSSRVPFDPQQKPKFGVLKSPPTVRKTPNSKKKKKSGANAAKTTPTRRPSAADFF